MANVFIEYKGKDQQVPILLEISRANLDTNELELVADDAANKRIIKAEATLREHFTGLRDFTDTIIEPYEKHDHSPDELVVEFGIRVGLEGGIVVTKAVAEASIQVKATWRRSS